MTLPPEVRAAAAAFAARPTVLVASDFDGVLAPLVDDPMASRPLPGTMPALRGLAALPGTYAAVVSGRDLATLTELTGLTGPDDGAVTRIGSHGAESSTSAASPGPTPAQQDLLQRLTDDFEALRAGLPAGAHVELKPSAVVLHTRRMAGPDARPAEEAALELAARHTGVHVLHGKHVVEVSVVRADKGSALVALRDAVGAAAVAYLGDDVTDEHAFTALGPDDLTVKVGDGPTAARFRVATPHDAAELLAVLLRERQQH